MDVDGIEESVHVFGVDGTHCCPGRTGEPACHNAEAYLEFYLEAAGIHAEKYSPLFRSIDKRKKITPNPITLTDMLRMVKRRAQEAGLPSSTCCHTFRATGIYLENGGTIENAQAIAAHECMNHHGRRSFTIERAMTSRSMRWRKF